MVPRRLRLGQRQLKEQRQRVLLGTKRISGPGEQQDPFSRPKYGVIIVRPNFEPSVDRDERGGTRRAAVKNGRARRDP
ncbi:MAG: hypothetical protein OXG19_05125 [Chloroflexi bacterium]|nr:hypothetical protein [Chloroflexota bacterium]